VNIRRNIVDVRGGVVSKWVPRVDIVSHASEELLGFPLIHKCRDTSSKPIK
jgi:hypothetical protein